MTLGIRLGRRLIACVGVDEERFAFQDSRFVPSRHARVLGSMGRYFRRVFEQVKPGMVYFYAPTDLGSVTGELVTMLEAEAATAGLSAKALVKSEIFGSFGLIPFRARHDLLDHFKQLWPAINEAKAPKQTALAEAAAAALIGDMYQEWPPV